MQETVRVHVNATFNTSGEVKPEYVWLEAEHEIVRYKIFKYYFLDKQKLAGFHCLNFKCCIVDCNKLKEIFLRYTPDIAAWHIYAN